MPVVHWGVHRLGARHWAVGTNLVRRSTIAALGIGAEADTAQEADGPAPPA